MQLNFDLMLSLFMILILTSIDSHLCLPLPYPVNLTYRNFCSSPTCNKIVRPKCLITIVHFGLGKSPFSRVEGYMHILDMLLGL